MALFWFFRKISRSSTRKKHEPEKQQNHDAAARDENHAPEVYFLFCAARVCYDGWFVVEVKKGS